MILWYPVPSQEGFYDTDQMTVAVGHLSEVDRRHSKSGSVYKKEKQSRSATKACLPSRYSVNQERGISSSFIVRNEIP